MRSWIVCATSALFGGGLVGGFFVTGGLACGGRPSATCADCGSNVTQPAPPAVRDEPQPTVSAPPEPELLSIEALFASGSVFVGSDGSCEAWSVAKSSESPDSKSPDAASPRPLVLEQPWSRQDPSHGVDCTGAMRIRIDRAEQTLVVHPPGLEEAMCGGYPSMISNPPGCGPHTWSIGTRTPDSITLTRAIAGDGEKPERRVYQTWSLSYKACMAEQKVAKPGGC